MAHFPQAGHQVAKPPHCTRQAETLPHRYDDTLNRGESHPGMGAMEKYNLMMSYSNSKCLGSHEIRESRPK